MTALMMPTGNALIATMVRGQVGTTKGYSISDGIGSLSPNDFKGEQINEIKTQSDDLIVKFADFSLPQTFFHSIKTSLGTFYTADADNFSSGEWTWLAAGFFSDSGSEDIVMTS